MLKHLYQSKQLRLLAKITLTLGAFWLLFRGVDMVQLTAMLQRQEPIWLLASLLFILCQIKLGALRWRLILNAIAPDSRLAFPMRELLRVNYISVFFQLLPAGHGGQRRGARVAYPLRTHAAFHVHSFGHHRPADRAGGTLRAGGHMLPWLGAIFHVDTPSPLPLLALAVALGLWALLGLDRLLRKWEHVRPVSWLLYFIGNLRLLVGHKLSAIAAWHWPLARISASVSQPTHWREVLAFT